VTEIKINREKLRALIDNNYTSDAEFARDYGIDPGYLCRILSGEKEGQKLIIQLLSRGLRDIFLP
jgi:predicted transcriptional regulator